MPPSTQISGIVRPHDQAFYSLIHLFHHVGIRVAHPLADEPLFYTPTGWQQLDDELAFYHSIASSKFHVVFGKAGLDRTAALQVAYAVLLQKPVVVAGKVTFTKNTPWFLREIIASCAEHFHQVDLAELELIELHLLLAKLKPTNYRLSPHKVMLIRSLLKAHFRAVTPKGD